MEPRCPDPCRSSGPTGPRPPYGLAPPSSVDSPGSRTPSALHPPATVHNRMNAGAPGWRGASFTSHHQLLANHLPALGVTSSQLAVGFQNELDRLFEILPRLLERAP